MNCKMNKSDAIKLIDAYLDGSLTASELHQFEVIARSDTGLASAIHRAKMVDKLLTDQKWVSPSTAFTQSVMSRIEANPGLEAASATEIPCEVQQDQILERLLEDQPLLSPTANFTHNVMQRVKLVANLDTELAPVSRRETILDWIQGLAPAAAIIVFVVMFGKSMLSSMLSYLQTSATFIDSAVGTKVFESQPLIQLGVIVPLIGVVIISAMVTRRLRLAS